MQNGRGGKRAARRFSEFLHCLAARIRALCAIALLASAAVIMAAEQRYAEMRRNFPPVEHPVVLVHPESGRKLIFVNMLYTTRITKVTRAESSALLALLTGLSAVPEWQVRFKWQPGSVAVWDNRAVQHYAVNDYHPYPRLMHRVAIY